MRAWAADAPLRARSIEAYLLTIARNLHRREWGRRRRSEAVPAVRDEASDTERQLIARSELSVAIRGLDRLPEVDRAALLMRAFSDLPYEVIATALNISVAAAKVKVHRARARLLADRNAP